MTHILGKCIPANHDRSYGVALSPGLSTGSVGDLVGAIKGRKSLLVTTPSVARLYANAIATRLLAAGVDLSMVVLECSEQSKTMAEVEKLCQECFRAGLDRESVIIGVGGGVCTDLVTMAASLTRRGLRYIKIPTTLIGLIDAGIGIKGAVNLPGKKSALGCFCPPDCVLLDPAFLRTLPRQLTSDGLAEAIKVGVAMDAELFKSVEQGSCELLNAPLATDGGKVTELVWRSCVRLLDELSTNLYEDRTYQRLLDFGHTFSPIIEADSEFQVSHGRSVAIDMSLSTILARHLGLLSSADQDRILGLLLSAGLPIFSELLTLERCTRAMEEIEAHRGGHLNLVVPTGVGSAVFITHKEQLPSAVLTKALDSLRRKAAQPVLISKKSVVTHSPVFEMPEQVRTGTSQSYD